jgi:Na+-transporting NADH:ubiquinone oxidoreductase subunit A
VSGEVVEVVRGEKRRLLEIRILADKELDYIDFTK